MDVFSIIEPKQHYVTTNGKYNKKKSDKNKKAHKVSIYKMKKEYRRIASVIEVKNNPTNEETDFSEDEEEYNYDYMSDYSENDYDDDEYYSYRYFFRINYY
jgi:hypothetical protein